MRAAALIVIFTITWLAKAQVFLANVIVTEDYLYPERTILPRISNETVVRGLLQRLIPEHADQFDLNIDHDIGPQWRDTFLLQEASGHVSITGTSPIALAMGVQHYLKYIAKLHVSWSGDQLNIEKLPLPSSPVKITANDGFRYYENVCTVSYSMVWWDWSRWQREIDWMALNGINLPLAFTAQEAIYYRVYKSVGLTDSEIGQFFSGPAFLAWNRMGNMQGFGGPLSQSWHTKKVALQHQILQRMREYGMVPVLPAFAGRVPPAFSRLFPDARIVNQTGHWGNFDPPYCCTSFLEPQDPLFVTMGSLFLQEYIKEFGTDHVYNTDLFNEMPSPSSDPEYLTSCGKAVFSSLTMVDPQAIWLMQGWIFVNSPTFWQPPQTKALLTSVPIGRMIILDLEAEFFPQYQRFESYYGQPFIWCMLHNFGGVLGLYGAFQPVNQGPFNARNFANSTMIGTGITPEGIEKNDVIFEFMNEMAWRKEPVDDLDQWLEYYATCRYGKNDSNLSEAWKLLRRSVYNATSAYINHGTYIMVSRPSLKRNPEVWYDPADVQAALKYFEKAAEDPVLQKQETFRFDFIDVGRQALQLAFAVQFVNLREAFKQKDIDQMSNLSNSMINILDKLEELLATDSHFRLDTWTSSAKSWASTPEEELQMVYNAKNQITLWGPTGQILDYANKQWSGVVSGYYKPRWELFFNTILNSIIRGKPFRQNDFNEKVLWFVEEPFTHKFDNSSKDVSLKGNFEAARDVMLRSRPETGLLISAKTIFLQKPQPKKLKKLRKKKLKHGEMFLRKHP